MTTRDRTAKVDRPLAGSDCLLHGYRDFRWNEAGPDSPGCGPLENLDVWAESRHGI